MTAALFLTEQLAFSLCVCVCAHMYVRTYVGNEVWVDGLG